MSSLTAGTSVVVARNSAAGKAHFGLKIDIRARAALAEALLYSLPQPFTHQPLPSKSADPHSKRSRRTAARTRSSQRSATVE
eukprot:8977542-Pyramimonas_sp.AAC.1